MEPHSILCRIACSSATSPFLYFRNSQPFTYFDRLLDPSKTALLHSYSSPFMRLDMLLLFGNTDPPDSSFAPLYTS